MLCCAVQSAAKNWRQIFQNCGGSSLYQQGSGIGTIAAIVALAATLFSLKINIHNLL